MDMGPHTWEKCPFLMYTPGTPAYTTETDREIWRQCCINVEAIPRGACLELSKTQHKHIHIFGGSFVFSYDRYACLQPKGKVVFDCITCRSALKLQKTHRVAVNVQFVSLMYQQRCLACYKTNKPRNDGKWSLSQKMSRPCISQLFISKQQHIQNSNYNHNVGTTIAWKHETNHPACNNQAQWEQKRKK